MIIVLWFISDEINRSVKGMIGLMGIQPLKKQSNFDFNYILRVYNEIK